MIRQSLSLESTQRSALADVFRARRLGDEAALVQIAKRFGPDVPAMLLEHLKGVGVELPSCSCCGQKDLEHSRRKDGRTVCLACVGHELGACRKRRNGDSGEE